MTADVSVATPRFENGTGPVVLIDGAHQNLHTMEAGYAPFAQLLQNDGLQIGANESTFDNAALVDVDLLVIANASAAGGSAFSPEGTAAVRHYVESGGALLLIVDHMPYPPAAEDLAAAFGATWLNVYADNTSDGRMTRRSGDLVVDPITDDITQVRTFGGSCFVAPEMRPLLIAGDTWSQQTESEDGTGLSPKVPANGCFIGAVAEVGAGSIGFFLLKAECSLPNDLSLTGAQSLWGSTHPTPTRTRPSF